MDINLGPLIITGFRGTSAADPEVDLLTRYIDRGSVGGVLLLERNIHSPEQLAALISTLRDASPGRPLIVSIDQEGGAVARFGQARGFLPWMSAAELATSELRDEEVIAYYTPRAAELAEVGINMNLGPVVDLNVNQFNPIIGAKGRSFGNNVHQVVRFAELFIRSHRAVGVRTCLKHFPGHGSSRADSHFGPADVSQTWTSAEIAPFERLVRAGFADSVMHAHVLHRYLSDEAWLPTSLSTSSVDELRYGLKFNGPVITDDLQMGAITAISSAAEAGVRAIEVGNTFLIYSNYQEKYPLETIADVNLAISAAIQNKKITEERARICSYVATAFRSLLGTID